MDENADSCESESVGPNKRTQATKAGVYFPELQQFFWISKMTFRAWRIGRYG